MKSTKGADIMPEITIFIPKGPDNMSKELTVEGHGFRGSACTTEIEKLVKSLGGKTTQRRGKEELVVRSTHQRVSR